MMLEPNIESIERYQKILDDDPHSRVFAPLAEAYRKNGNLQRALQICRVGLSHNPEFAGGWYQLGRIFNQRNETEKAVEAFKKATQLSPENIQAQRALAELSLKLGLVQDALKAYKLILLINSHDQEALSMVGQLENGYFERTVVEKTEHAIEDFEVRALKPKNPAFSNPSRSAQLKHSVLMLTTMVDALIERNEFAKARLALQKALIKYGEIPEIKRRLDSILRQQDHSLEVEGPEIATSVAPREERLKKLKLAKLKKWILKIKPDFE